MRTPISQLKKRETGILKLLNKPRIRFGPEDFHRLRLEIKKTDALFRLAGFVSNDFDRRESFTQIHSIFALAGKVRNWQLCEQLISAYRKKPGANLLLKKVRKKKKEARQAFFEGLKSIPHSRLLQSIRKAGKCLRTTQPKQVKHYLKNIEERIRKLLKKKKGTNPDLHEIRKWLKISSYLHKCLPVGEALNVPEYKTLPVDLIGTWHDLQVSAEQIEQLIQSAGYTDGEKKGLTGIVVALRKKEGGLLKKMLGRISA